MELKKLMIFEKIKTKNANLAFLTLGMLSMSQAGVLIKLTAASIYSVAFYRVLIASLILFIMYPKDIISCFKSITLKDFFYFFSAGFFLSLHFLTWNESFKYITVATATLVIATSPIFVSLFAYIFFKEKPNKNFYISFVLCFLGLILVSFESILSSRDDSIGLVYVFLSTLLFVFYFLLGKKNRKKTSTGVYLFNLYFSSSIVSFFFYIFNEPSFVYTEYNYLFFILLAVFPTLIGHGSVNHVINYFKASTVSMNQLVQPLFASVVAYLILNETVTYISVFGYFFILVGVFVLLKGFKK